MTCPSKPPVPPRDSDGALLIYANKAGTAALVLSQSAKVLPPAGAALAQALGLGIAANFRVPTSVVAGATAAINSQPTNSVVGGITFNREALAITGGVVQTFGIAPAILGMASGWGAIAVALGMGVVGGLADNWYKKPCRAYALQADPDLPGA